MSCPAWWTRGESNSRPKKCAATGTQALGCYEYELRCEERCDTVGDTSKHVCFYWLLRGLRCLSARHRLYVNLTTFSSKPLRARTGAESRDRTESTGSSDRRNDHTCSLCELEPHPGIEPGLSCLRGRRVTFNTSEAWSAPKDSNLESSLIRQR